MSEKRFTSLRKRLDQLGYRQPLVIEAVPLVEKLFGDLIHTTENFKNYKAKTNVIDKDIFITDATEPYKNDNKKLVKENNELHLQLIKAREENDNLIAGLKASVRKLEHENQDLKFLNSQYIHKMKSLEKESKLKSDRIQSLQEKNLNAVVETPGGQKKYIPFRRQRMDIDSTLPPNTSASLSSSNHTVSDPYVADLLGIADSQAQIMKSDLKELEAIKDSLERKNHSLKKQVTLRDKEIKRLNEMLDGGRPVEAILKEQHRSSSDKVVAHLNMQVDYLQQANQELQEKLHVIQHSQAKTDTTIQDFKERNDELCIELAAMDKICKNMGKEKHRADGEIDAHIVALKEEIQLKQQTIIDLQASNYNLKKERDSLIEESQRINQLLKNLQADNQTITELFEKSEKEKKRLVEKNAKLTVSERELVMDLERVKVSKGVLPKKTQSPDRFQFLVRNIEDDRDYFKKECEELQKILHNKLFVENNLLNKSKVENDGVISVLQEERDYYKRELQKVKDSKKNVSISQPDKDSATIKRLRKERDELRNMLESFEKHLNEIQESVRAVTSEKDNIQMLYEQSIEEIQRLRRQGSNRGGKSPSNNMSRKVTEILEKAEKERDDALNELRKSRADIHSLRNDIKLLQDKHYEDKKSYNTQERNSEDLLSKIESDNRNLTNQLQSNKTLLHTLEEQLSAAHKTIRELNDDIHEKDNVISKLRLLIEQNDQTSDDLRKRLEEKTMEFSSQIDANHSLEEKIDYLSKKELDYKNEIVRLKGIINTLDHERDTLQQQMDDKTEQLVTLDDGLRQQEKADQDLKLSLEELEENLRYREQELTSKDREITSLSKQLRSVEEELAAVTKLRDVTVKENKRLHDDLAIMTEENQNVHKNLQEVLDESHGLKQQVEEYALQLTRIQDVLAEKEMEKDDLLLQYRTLSNKADILETNFQNSEDEAETIKQDLLHKQQEINYLHDRCAALESEIEQHISTEETYENQVATLHESRSNMEVQLKVTQEEKETILEDLFAVRELCVKLDQTREDLTKRVAVKTSDQEKFESMLKDAHAETEMLRNQVNKEKDISTTLENIISQSREKEYFDKRSHDEGLLDLEKIKNDFNKVQQEKKYSDNENSLLRKQNHTLEIELTALKNQLTTEKYEKERLKQELRRNSRSPSPGGRANISTTDVSSTKRYTSNQNIRGSYISSSKNLSPLPTHVPDLKPFSPINVSFSSDDSGNT